MKKNQTKKNLFDRFVEQFSSKALETRVRLVVVLGFLLCIVALTVGWFLFTHEFFVANKPGLESVKFMDLLFKETR